MELVPTASPSHWQCGHGHLPPRTEEDKEREDVNNVSVSESLVVVNKILSNIDQDLDNHLTEEGIPEGVDNASRGGQPEKNFSFDSLREEKSKKSISFR